MLGGKKAYCLSYGENKNTPKSEQGSGLTFGGNQMDMGGNKDAGELFIDILSNAVDENGNKYFMDKEAKKIEDTEKHQTVKHTPEQVFGKDLDRVNNALASDYGIKKINEAYLIQLTKDLKWIEQVISNIKVPAVKKFYDTDLGKVLLFDFHNMLKITPGKEMISFLNGEKVKLKNGVEFCNKDKSVFTFEDHKQYVLNQKEAQENTINHDRIENRLKYCLKVIEESEATGQPVSDNLDPAYIQPASYTPNAEKHTKITIHTASDIQAYEKSLGAFADCLKANYPEGIDELIKLNNNHRFAIYPYPGNEANVVKHVAPYEKCADILIETRYDTPIHEEL